MRTAILGAVLSAVFAAGMATAHATDIVYNWVNLTVDPEYGPYSGSISINPQYWSLNGTLDSSGIPPPAFYGLSYFGVDSFSFSAGPGVEFDSIYDGVEPCVAGGDCFPSAPPGTLIFGGTGNSLYSGSSFELNLGLVLTGSIDNHGNFSDLTMAGGPVWTVTELGADEGMFNVYGDLGTGIWVIDPATIPVPEPGTLALTMIAFGLTGILARRRIAALST